MKPKKRYLIPFIIIFIWLIMNARGYGQTYSDKEFKTPHDRDYVIVSVKNFTGLKRLFNRGMLICINHKMVEHIIYISRKDTNNYKIGDYQIENKELRTLNI